MRACTACGGAARTCTRSRSGRKAARRSAAQSSGCSPASTGSNVAKGKDSSLNSSHVKLRRTDSSGLDRRERVDDLIGGHHGRGVVRDIDVESGVHLLIRVTRGRVFHHRDLVAKLSGKAYSGLHACVGPESDDDELMNAMLLELHIQIGVGKAAGTPMLKGHDVARLRCEFAADLAAPRPVFEGLMRPGCLLDRRDVQPGLVVAGTVPMMQRIEDAKPRLPRRMQNLQHMRNTTIRFCDSLQAIPCLAALGNEIVIRIDHQKCSELLVVWHVHHGLSPTIICRWLPMTLGIKVRNG